MENKIKIEVEQGNALQLNNSKIGILFTKTHEEFAINLEKEYTLHELREVLQNFITVIDMAESSD
jgi:hypothetical protein